MQLEIYSLIALKDQISVSLEAICDSYSSLLWDIEFYQCGCFEVYIAASPQNVSIFQRGRIVARSDDAQHFGIIESLQLETDAEKGDYLTVTGRFLACLLERRIIYPTITANGSYEDIVRKVLSRNVISAGIRNLPGFSMGTVSGDCWQNTARMQVSYDNILLLRQSVRWLLLKSKLIRRLIKVDSSTYDTVFSPFLLAGTFFRLYYVSV